MEQINDGKYPVSDKTVEVYRKSPKYAIKALVRNPMRCMPPTHQVIEKIVDSSEEIDEWLISNGYSIIAVTIYSIEDKAIVEHDRENILKILQNAKEQKEKEQLQKLKDKYEKNSFKENQ